MCEPRAEPSLLELCRGEAINRINPNLCASREQSHALKCQPDRIEEQKTQYSCIGKPYNMSPKHWIDIDASTAPDDILRELTRNSYKIIETKYKKHGSNVEFVAWLP